MAKRPAKKTEVEQVDEDTVLDNLTDEELEALAQELEAESEEDDETEEEESVEEAVTQDDVDATNGMGDKFKTNRLSIAMKALSGMDNWQIDHFLKSLEQIGHEADGVPGSASAQNQGSIQMKGSPADIGGISAKGLSESLKATLKEDLAAVFGDNKDLSEEFKENLATLFEASVSYRVSAIEQVLLEQYTEAFETEVGELTEALIEKLDDYITFVGEKWIEENKLAIEKTLTAELAEDLLTDMRAVFENHNIAIPSDKVDVLEAQATKIAELEEALNTTLEDNMMLTEAVKESERTNLVTEFTTGMTLSQTEKFKQLIESIEYDGDNEDFVKKLGIVKNSHFKDAKNSKTPSTNIITEEISYRPDAVIEEENDAAFESLDPEMKANVLALKRATRA